jgi:hypothetical protein
MSLKSRTRYAGAVCMMAASYIFAAFLWVYSLGCLWPDSDMIIVGLCLAYVGIIPLTFILALIYGAWELLVPMLIFAACITFTRIMMGYALGKYEKCAEGTCVLSEQGSLGGSHGKV